MSLQIYPELLRGLTYTVLKSPEFDTLIESAANKYDFRLPQTVNPFWSWQLTYEYLKDYPWDMVLGLITTDYRVLLDFFLAQQGQSGTFLFLDPDDNYVGPAMNGGVPNTPLAQLPSIVTDGQGNYYSPIQRTFGGLFYEDITDLNLLTSTGGSPLLVYDNGVLQVLSVGNTHSDYTVGGPGLTVPTASFMGMYIQWGKALFNNGASPNAVAGGTLAARTYYSRMTLVTSTGGETTPNAEVSIAIPANELYETGSPTPNGRSTVIGWNIYIGTTAGSETKQNTSVIPLGTSWTEPTTGLITGAAMPTIDTSAKPAGPVTAQFGFYFRVRFATDSQDFEKFMNKLWCVGGDYSKNGSGVLKLCTSRPVPL